WGNSNTVVTHNSPNDFSRLPAFFDLILVDAPCSGEGMFRKDPDSIAEWSLENVQICVVRQTQILQDAWLALKPGGHLIYSTCTLNPNENEKVLHELVEKTKAQFVEVPQVKQFGVIQLGSEPIYRCVPGLVEGEGFSFAVIQ